MLVLVDQTKLMHDTSHFRSHNYFAIFFFCASLFWLIVDDFVDFVMAQRHATTLYRRYESNAKNSTIKKILNNDEINNRIIRSTKQFSFFVSLFLALSLVRWPRATLFWQLLLVLMLSTISNWRTQRNQFRRKIMIIIVPSALNEMLTATQRTIFMHHK